MNRHILGFDVEDQNDPCIKSIEVFKEYFVDHISTKVMKKRTSSLIDDNLIKEVVKNYFAVTIAGDHDKVFNGRVDISLRCSTNVVNLSYDTLLIKYYPSAWLDPGEVLEIYQIVITDDVQFEYSDIFSTLIKRMKKEKIEFEYTCVNIDMENYHSMQLFLKNSNFEFFWKLINLIEIECFRNIDLTDF